MICEQHKNQLPQTYIYLYLQPTLGVASSDSALLYAILSPVGDYFRKAESGAVSLLADPRYTRYVL